MRRFLPHPRIPQRTAIVWLCALGCACAGERDGVPEDHAGSTTGSTDAGSTGRVDSSSGGPGEPGTQAETGVGAETGLGPDVPRLEPAACRFDLQEYVDAGLQPSCGDLFVFEDRVDQAREIAIHLVRFPAQDPVGPPIVILNGGPGGSTEGTILRQLPPFAIQVASSSADVVLFDPRGVGRSMPRLGCPLPFDRHASAAELSADKQAAQAECRREYEAAGIDLAAYDTVSNADDVEDLRIAIGETALNLVGLSYGSRVALEVLRRHPEAVRAVVLDAVVPAHERHFLEYVGDFELALMGLLEACAEEPACGAAYPDLYARFLEAAAALDDEPLELPGVGSVLTGGWLVQDVYASLRRSNRHGDIPALIHAAAERDVAGVEAFYAQYSSLVTPAIGADANAMNRSVTCSDRWQYTSEAEVEAALQGVAEPIAAHFRATDFDYNLASCEQWPHADPRPGWLEPVASDVPALLLSGQFDPRTPPRMAEAAAEHLPFATTRVVGHGGHGVSVDLCALLWVLEFLADPEAPLGGSCTIEIDFTLPPR